MIETLREEISKSIKEIYNTEQWKEMNKIIQNLKVEIESIKETQTDGNLEMKILETQTGTLEASLTNRIQKMEERLSDVEDNIEE
jgi:predicted  nucleic acid-binding Zn-ribbon protein